MAFLTQYKRRKLQEQYPDWNLRCNNDGVAEEIVMSDAQRIATKDIQEYRIYPDYWELTLVDKIIQIRAKGQYLDSVFRGIHQYQQPNTTSTTLAKKPEENTYSKNLKVDTQAEKNETDPMFMPEESNVDARDIAIFTLMLGLCALCANLMLIWLVYYYK